MCNKLSPDSEIQNRLIGALIGLARATDGNEHLISGASTAVILESLVAAFEDGDMEGLLARVVQEKRNMVPDCFTCACPCGKNNDYDMQLLWNDREDIRSLKCRILSGLRELAGCGRFAAEADRILYKALIVIGLEDFGAEQLQNVLQEVEQMRKTCGEAI